MGYDIFGFVRNHRGKIDYLAWIKAFDSSCATKIAPASLRETAAPASLVAFESVIHIRGTELLKEKVCLILVKKKIQN
jgi:hypothetical protein